MLICDGIFLEFLLFIISVSIIDTLAVQQDNDCSIKRCRRIIVDLAFCFCLLHFRLRVRVLGVINSDLRSVFLSLLSWLIPLHQELVVVTDTGWSLPLELLPASTCILLLVFS